MTAVLGSVIAGATAGFSGTPGPQSASTAQIDALILPERAAPDAASRSNDRTLEAPAETPSAGTATPARPRQAQPIRPPRPVAGLSQSQMNNAAVIVQVGRERGLPRRAMLVAMITAMQESNLNNLANSNVPGSLRRPHQGVGSDHDSVGLFQQRSSQGWGSVAELMDPRYAATAFYQRLIKVPDWEDKSLTLAAQAVQRSAFPRAYAKHSARAEIIVDSLL